MNQQPVNEPALNEPALAAPVRSRREGLGPLVVLMISQLLSGVGVASGIAVGGLLAEKLAGTVSMAGLAQTSSVLGAGLWAIPLARLAVRRGRRWSLTIGYSLAVFGAVLVFVAAGVGSIVVLCLGMLAFGAATASGLQARFAATEVVSAGYRARAMSLVLWSTTLGAVAGPNLSRIGSDLGARLGIEPLAGPYLFSLLGLAAAALIVGLRLHAPRRVAWSTDGTDGGEEEAAEPVVRLGVGAALRAGFADPSTRLALVTVTASHMIMVGVMVMTPVHMHHHGLSLDLVGLAISIHIVGMYGASPVMGWLADRISARGVIIIGVGILTCAVLVGGFFGDGGMVPISVTLGLLGLGWSAGVIGGSTLLTESAPEGTGLTLQGASDSGMNLAAAASSAFSGPILAWGGYAALSGVAGVFLVPLVVLLILGFLRRRG